MTQIRLLSLGLVLLLAAATVSASVHTFVSDGKLLVAGNDGESVRALALDSEPMDAFGLAAGRVLFTVEHAAPQSHSDVVGPGEVNLWVTDLSGDARQLTSDQLVMTAQWSDALDKIVYWTLEKKVYTMDLDGGARELLLESSITPSLSPDGRQLAYVLTPADWAWDYHCVTFELHVRDLFTGEDRVVLRGTDANEPFWTPDGSSLIFQSSGLGVTSLWRVAATGGTAEQLTNVGMWTSKNPYFVKNPSRNTDVSWSADGRSLLFGASYSEAGEVMVIELDESYDVRRSFELTEGRHPFWSEKGTVLVLRPEVAGVPTKSQAMARFEEFPVDETFAREVVDVANAPRHFEAPADFRGAPDPSFVDTKAIDRYRWPIHSSAGHPYSAYYDNNGGGGVLDWKCGTYTYNGHKGTDVAVAGWWIYSGAYGTTWTSNDGCPTVGYYCSSCGGGFGNYIKLSHGSAQGRNWYTTYAHFRNGSVIPGTHGCGSRVGISGSSGCSTGYHVHFQVDAYGHPYDDPFSGSCSGSVSYWCNQNGGYPTTGCC